VQCLTSGFSVWELRIADFGLRISSIAALEIRNPQSAIRNRHTL